MSQSQDSRELYRRSLRHRIPAVPVREMEKQWAQADAEAVAQSNDGLPDSSTHRIAPSIAPTTRRDRLENMVLTRSLPPEIPMRINRVARVLAARLPENSNVLYLGADHGEIADVIMDLRPDVMMRAGAVCAVEEFVGRMACSAFDGHHIAHRDESFDTVIFCDLLHRLPDPLYLLREARRCSRRSVIIKDIQVESEDDPPELMRLAHWLQDIAQTELKNRHYLTRHAWRSMFARVGLVTHTLYDNLHLGSSFSRLVSGPRHHFMAELMHPVDPMSDTHNR
jgi:SAM-dependent methyltransferase